MYLLVNNDRPNDHLFRLFSFHVVQPQGVNLGSQVASLGSQAQALIRQQSSEGGALSGLQCLSPRSKKSPDSGRDN